MVDEQRALLDSLLGKDRDLGKDTKRKKDDHWEDEDVCPYFLCEFCPHLLFTNTKSDLGNCGYKHSATLRDAFQKESEARRRNYERQFLDNLRQLARDCDKKVRRGKERVDLNLTTSASASSSSASTAASSTQPMTAAMLAKVDQKLKDIATRRQQLRAECVVLSDQMEAFGNEDRIDDCEALLLQFEAHTAESCRMDELESQFRADPRSALTAVATHSADESREERNKFEVCDVCGVFQAIDDADDRKARHYEGKQHIGYDRIRKAIVKLEKRLFSRSTGRRSSMRSSIGVRGSRGRGGGRSRGRGRRHHSRSRSRERREVPRGYGRRRERDRDYRRY